MGEAEPMDLILLEILNQIGASLEDRRNEDVAAQICIRVILRIEAFVVDLYVVAHSGKDIICAARSLVGKQPSQCPQANVLESVFVRADARKNVPESFINAGGKHSEISLYV